MLARGVLDEDDEETTELQPCQFCWVLELVEIVDA